MSLDSQFLFSFFLIFIRCSALLMSSPIFGSSTPVTVRIWTSATVSLALVAILKQYIGPLPANFFDLGAAILHEVLIGLLIGFCIHLLLFAAQMAGAFLDLQIGLGMAQLLNPAGGNPVSVISHFKYMLALVLLLQVNGHHQMFQALVDSYQLNTQFNAENMAVLLDQAVHFFGQISLLSLQIAAPVTAVALVVDVATGLVSKAVPQIPAFLIGMPAKFVMGFLALAIGLPLLVEIVYNGLEHTMSNVSQMLGVGNAK